ncbi:MAG: quinone-dependent dihydroorotate dehydrogenase [Vicingaceae bacterium]
MLYQKIIKPYLFRSDPEEVHYRVFGMLKRMLKSSLMKSITKGLYNAKSEKLKQTIWGLEFDSPVGLAAGFDKDAKLIDELACFGFGFIEVGTVTPKPQEGNPKPRLFRLPKDEALINRMGFNNEGVEATVSRLKERKSKVIVGGNIGKNKVTPNENATEDYLISFKALKPYVDYFVVNVSSPNTPNLRALQEKEPLKKLLNSLQEENKKAAPQKPILLKIAPDLTESQLDDIVEIVEETKIDGIIATNTTIDRTNLITDAVKVDEIGAGGLSGKPLKRRSTEVISYLKQNFKRPFPIIAVGGVFNAADAIEKLEAGADLVQVYTGFVYEGPGMINKINKGLVKYYEQKGS